MSVYEDISQALRTVIDELKTTKDISPGIVANLCYLRFGSTSDEIHVRYLGIEQCKAMARKLLGAKFDSDGQENDAHQGDLFSGQLQKRYPIMRAPDDEPVYRPLEHLSLADLNWNIQHLLKSADARIEHARALQGYRDARARDLSGSAA